MFIKQDIDNNKINNKNTKTYNQIPYNKGKKTSLAILGLFTTLALILSYVDSLLPVLPAIPGVKLGLANLIFLIVMTNYGIRDAVLVNIVRIVLTGLLFGNVFSIAYSLAGAIIAMLIMYVFYRRAFCGIMGISILGGIFHNIGQMFVAFLIVKSAGVWYYLPYLFLAGCLCGAVMGVIANILSSRLKPLMR